MDINDGRPAYVPAHKLPCWLSSVDVHAAIRGLAEQGVDKAACWDFTQAIYKLAERSLAPSDAREGGG